MDIEHPVLGKVVESDKNPGSVEASIRFGGHTVPVRIDPDDCMMEEAIEFASELVSELGRLEPDAKKIVVRELCPVYNGGWNEYDEVQDNGSHKTVKNPELSADEFADKLSLNEIGITGNECVELWYDDRRMFWGHGVLFSSFDGVDFSEGRAELFG